MKTDKLLVLATAAILSLTLACKREPIAADGGASAPGTSGGGGGGRDTIRIVGSSTVYPFTTAVAERFGRGGGFKTPVIESTGTGGGFKLFCAGVGVGHPDLTNASRAIKESEVADCGANGVGEPAEIKIGYDGIVVASAKGGTSFALTRPQLFLALAKEVPSGQGQLQPNQHVRWNQIDPSLPNHPIEVYGPPPTSGTRDAFVELVMEPGCSDVDWIAALKESDEDRFKQICHAVREDGRYIESGENDNLIVQKLAANPQAAGIFGYSFLDQNSDQLVGATIDGVAPTFDAIADGSYPVSRPLFVYAKRPHVGVIPGVPEFVSELTSDGAIGADGYLTQIGLIPLPADELAATRQVATSLQPGAPH